MACGFQLLRVNQTERFPQTAADQELLFVVACCCNEFVPVISSNRLHAVLDNVTNLSAMHAFVVKANKWQKRICGVMMCIMIVSCLKIWQSMCRNAANMSVNQCHDAQRAV